MLNLIFKKSIKMYHERLNTHRLGVNVDKNNIESTTQKEKSFQTNDVSESPYRDGFRLVRMESETCIILRNLFTL